MGERLLHSVTEPMSFGVLHLGGGVYVGRRLSLENLATHFFRSERELLAMGGGADILPVRENRSL